MVMSAHGSNHGKCESHFLSDSRSWWKHVSLFTSFLLEKHEKKVVLFHEFREWKRWSMKSSKSTHVRFDGHYGPLVKSPLFRDPFRGSKKGSKKGSRKEHIWSQKQCVKNMQKVIFSAKSAKAECGTFEHFWLCACKVLHFSTFWEIGKPGGNHKNHDFYVFFHGFPWFDHVPNIPSHDDTWWHPKGV